MLKLIWFLVLKERSSPFNWQPLVPKGMQLIKAWDGNEIYQKVIKSKCPCAVLGSVSCLTYWMMCCLSSLCGEGSGWQKWKLYIWWRAKKESKFNEEQRPQRKRLHQQGPQLQTFPFSQGGLEIYNVMVRKCAEPSRRLRRTTSTRALNYSGWNQITAGHPTRPPSQKNHKAYVGCLFLLWFVRMSSEFTDCRLHPDL